MYIKVKYKLQIALFLGAIWCGFSIWLGFGWISDLVAIYGRVGAIAITASIAFIPGFINVFLLTGLLFDDRPKISPSLAVPPVSVLIAAYNEQNNIHETIESIARQEYPANIEIICVSDGSTDKTVFYAEAAKKIYEVRGLSIKIIELKDNIGKASALNIALKESSHKIIVTVDADSYVFKDGLKHLVLNLIHGPKNTPAVAGTVLVRNYQKNILTRMQEWDYFLGIAVVKRVQSLLQGTMVAQGAFSAYRRKELVGAGGWPESVGEDIVLTWALQSSSKNYRVGYAENAFVFTSVPEKYSQFFSQRKRWSRGLIEALKCSPKILLPKRLNSPFAYFNVLFPIIDLAYLGIFIPGVFLAIFFNYYAIAGLMTLFLLPLALILNYTAFMKQRKIFLDYGLKVKQNIFGFIMYLFFYQLIMAPACLFGYGAEIFKSKKTWGTK